MVKSEDISTCWPPRSPDLSALDFLLWCRFKFAVYVNPPRAFAALKRRIQDGCEKTKLYTFGISSSRISSIPTVKIVNQLKEQTSLLSCFRYKACCNTCRYKIRISRHTAAFISSLRIVATFGRMPVAAIDMHGESPGDPSAARGIHYRAAQGPPPQLHHQHQQLLHRRHKFPWRKQWMNEWTNPSHAAYKSDFNQIHISWDVKIVLNVIRNLVNRLWHYNSACIVGYPARDSWHKQRVVSISYVTQWGTCKEFKFSQIQSGWRLG